VLPYCNRDNIQNTWQYSRYNHEEKIVQRLVYFYYHCCHYFDLDLGFLDQAIVYSICLPMRLVLQSLFRKNLPTLIWHIDQAITRLFCQGYICAPSIVHITRLLVVPRRVIMSHICSVPQRGWEYMSMTISMTL
jgi:hypothetical protein